MLSDARGVALPACTSTTSPNWKRRSVFTKRANCIATAAMEEETTTTRSEGNEEFKAAC